MSRKIKYRVWDEEKKKYCTEYNAMTLKHDGEFCIERGWCIISGGFEVEQSTLLKDKNGKEIYEGDIVLDYYDGDDAFVVEWDKDTASFRLTGTDGIASVSFDNFYSDKDLEVIGNIHENPELLGGEDGRDK